MFELWRLYGGAPASGLGPTIELTAAALDALWVIESATAYRREQADAEARAEAEAARANRDHR